MSIDFTDQRRFSESFYQCWEELQNDPRDSIGPYFVSDRNRASVDTLIHSIYSLYKGRHNHNGVLLTGWKSVGKTFLIESLRQVVRRKLDDRFITAYVLCSSGLKLPSEALYEEVQKCQPLREKFNSLPVELQQITRRDINEMISFLVSAGKRPIVAVDELQEAYIKTHEHRDKQIQGENFVKQLCAIGESRDALGWLTGSTRSVIALAYQHAGYEDILDKYIQYPSLNDSKYKERYLYTLRSPSDIRKLWEIVRDTDWVPSDKDLIAIFRTTGGAIGRLVYLAEMGGDWEGQRRPRFNTDHFTDAHWYVLTRMIAKYSDVLKKTNNEHDLWAIEDITDGDLKSWLDEYNENCDPDDMIKDSFKYRLVDNYLLEKGEGVYSPNVQYLCEAPNLLQRNNNKFLGISTDLDEEKPDYFVAKMADLVTSIPYDASKHINDKEGYVHIIFHTALYISNNRPISEPQTASGRADICVVTARKQVQYIFELKHTTKRSDVKKLLQEAMDQITAKGYDKMSFFDTDKPIWHVAIVHCSQPVNRGKPKPLEHICDRVVPNKETATPPPAKRTRKR
uniref:Uncharacterized protein n=1 Tax=Branchiostoma floridae TaxID=7739 RepID=C3Z4W2_BRAFL|eukprot:XP_002596307.1 hypothetical protein BRAFLDRAFT_123067 [Branchiostoma floridae]